jgi:hypothetical protein
LMGIFLFLLYLPWMLWTVIESPHGRWNIKGPVFYTCDTVSGKMQHLMRARKNCDIYVCVCVYMTLLQKLIKGIFCELRLLLAAECLPLNNYNL